MLPWARRARAVLAALLLGATAVPVSAGQELRWGHLRLVAPAEVDSTAWFEALQLEGRSVKQAPLGLALRRGLQWLAGQGYPFAEARPGSFDLKAGRVEGTVVLDPGVRARIAALVLRGAKVTRPSTASRITGIHAGDSYTGTEEETAVRRLVRSGLFTSVGKPDLLPGVNPEDVILEVPVSEPPYTRFAAVLGASGRNSGLTGLVDLELHNLAGTGREASGRWENRGRGLTRYGLHIHEPWLPLVPVGVRGDLSHDLNEGVYSFTKWSISGDLKWGQGWRMWLGKGGTRAVETAGSLGATSEGFVLAGLELDHRNSVLVPTRGYRAAVESRRGQKHFAPAADSLEVRLDRSRWRVNAEGYLPLGNRWLMAVKARLAYLDTPEDTIPRYDLFAVGGANSLRGYREEQFLTPALAIVQVEWRWLQDPAGSALYIFSDAGLLSPQRGRRQRDRFNRFLLGTGVGVRQATRLGILGVEYGVGKGESPLDGRIHLHLDAAF